MAGDWIQVDQNLTKKREVVTLSRLTSRSRHEVSGLLMDLWGWVSNESCDGHVAHVTVDDLPALAGADRQFWEAVAEVGWIEFHHPDGLSIPRFEKWMSNGAKSRSQDALRKRRSRARQRQKSQAGHGSNGHESHGNDTAVTDNRDVPVTKSGPQDKTGQNSTPPPPQPPASGDGGGGGGDVATAVPAVLQRVGVVNPTLDEVACTTSLTADAVLRHWMTLGEPRDPVGLLVSRVRAGGTPGRDPTLDEVRQAVRDGVLVEIESPSGRVFTVSPANALASNSDGLKADGQLVLPKDRIAEAIAGSASVAGKARH
jgi:hypothetical protein